MTDFQWKSFEKFRNTYKKYCIEWNDKLSEKLFPLQKKARKIDEPEYNLETAIVYNTSFDEITQNDDIHLIVVGDNPGKEEQLAKNRKYLVGQAGRIANGFFMKNTDLGTDFRKNVIIMNKTPIHSGKTNHLKYILKNADEDIKCFILDSQRECASLVHDLHCDLIKGAQKGNFIPELWLVGYSELKEKKIFDIYRKSLKDLYLKDKSAWDKVFVYQHFSMNCFTKELANYTKLNPQIGLKQSLYNIGTKHKKDIFDC